jgi:hypothetical protein
VKRRRLPERVIDAGMRMYDNCPPGQNHPAVQTRNAETIAAVCDVTGFNPSEVDRVTVYATGPLLHIEVDVRGSEWQPGFEIHTDERPWRSDFWTIAFDYLRDVAEQRSDMRTMLNFDRALQTQSDPYDSRASAGIWQTRPSMTRADFGPGPPSRPRASARVWPAMLPPDYHEDLRFIITDEIVHRGQLVVGQVIRRAVANIAKRGAVQDVEAYRDLDRFQTVVVCRVAPWEAKLTSRQERANRDAIMATVIGVVGPMVGIKPNLATTPT